MLEPEVVALFIHFIDQYKGPVDNLALAFWMFLKDEEMVVSSTSGDNDEDIKKPQYRGKFNQNPWLRSRFSSMSQTMLIEMIKKMIKVLMSKQVMAALSEDAEKIRKVKITLMKFDEFTKLYFKICRSYPQYLAKVWPNIAKIKNSIIYTSSLIRIGITFY